MKILNFGSLNIDRTYSVEHFVQPKETISALDLNLFCGGKGLNQSIALARAKAVVYHAGAIGEDGDELLRCLQESNVDTSQIVKKKGKLSGHAIIQVDPSGQNSIIVMGGTNKEIDEHQIDETLRLFTYGDCLLLQNEISNGAYLIHQAKQRGMIIALNPSPIDQSLLNSPLELVDYLILNEVEASHLAGIEETSAQHILDSLSLKYPQAKIIMTVGKEGAYYKDSKEQHFHDSCLVKAVDTTAAGDTFCGYYLACLSRGYSNMDCLHYATIAAGRSVTLDGASSSIPTWNEMLAFEKQNGTIQD